MMRVQSLAGAWEFRQLGTEEWLPASVPGGAHNDLLALGHIPDPFVADNEKRVQWVAESDWVYRCSFTCAPELLAEEKIFLVCDGLDTLAKVVLTDHELGHTDNMFRRYEWEVGSLLNPKGANELIITFKSPVKYATEVQAIHPLAGVSQAISGGPYLRKAPYQFGWGWGPQLPPVSIWKDIRLEVYSEARLADVHLRQDHTGAKVMIEARISLEQWGEKPVSASVRITPPNGEIIGEVLTSGHAPASVPPQASTLACKLDFSSQITDDNVRALVFIAELWQRDQFITRQTAYFVPIKHLTLTDPAITVTLQIANRELIVQLNSRSLALLVEVSLTGADAIFSDNYFNLPAGRSIQISCPLPAGWTLARLKKKYAYAPSMIPIHQKGINDD